MTSAYKKLLIKKPEDRLTVAKILIDNDYTVRQTRVKRGKGTMYDYFVEYMPNRKTESSGGDDEG